MSRVKSEKPVSVRPVTLIIVCFVLWKALLLLTACLSPGGGYDSSSSLALQHGRRTSPGGDAVPSSQTPALTLATKLTRWDAIYFTAIAHRGYVFEQEWAFGWGFGRLLAILSRGAALVGVDLPSGQTEALVGIGVAHVGHLAAVLMLYGLWRTVAGPKCSPTGAVVAALLHVISPAGIFLSAPYAESVFAALSFAGYWSYAQAVGCGAARSRPVRDGSLVLAGACFGVATTMRSNGLFNGLLFLYDVATTMKHPGRLGLADLQRLMALGLGGSLVGLGFLYPQWRAYAEYCLPALGRSLEARPWCHRPLPSVYTWVQERYWNVGFLRYWTLGNLPLFLLAAPMLAIMIGSAGWAWRPSELGSRPDHGHDLDQRDRSRAFLRRLAVPQLVVAVLALTSYHVQIITRIASAYPLWYCWLASAMDDGGRSALHARPSKLSGLVVRWMVMYGLIQAVLFASFLPPA